MPDRPLTVGESLLIALACLASGVVIGAAYSVVAPPLVPYSPVAVSGWLFILVAAGCTVALGLGIGFRHPRAVLLSAGGVALLSSALYAVMLALPSFAPATPNIIGLVNYSLTQATVTFFIVSFIAFPGAITGLLVSYFWHDR
jgi:hypothetical protein